MHWCKSIPISKADRQKLGFYGSYFIARDCVCSAFTDSLSTMWKASVEMVTKNPGRLVTISTDTAG